MTDKPEKKPETTALVPLIEAPPPAKIERFAARCLPAANEAFREDVQAMAVPLFFSNAAWVVQMGCFSALVTAGSPDAAFLSVIGVVFASMFNNGLASDVPYISNQAYRKHYKSLEEKFVDQQKRPIDEMQDFMLKTAEDHLAAGKHLSARDVAWLIGMPDEKLKAASDQLAITVLQARKILARARSPEGNKTGKPLGFAVLNLNPDFTPDRKKLREHLVEDACKLPEMEPHQIQEGAVTLKKGLSGGFLRQVGYTLAAPLMTVVDYMRVRHTEVSAEFPDVKIAMPRCAEDFEAALEFYESQNGAADMPGMRGWGTCKPKTIAGPLGPRR